MTKWESLILPNLPAKAGLLPDLQITHSLSSPTLVMGKHPFPPVANTLVDCSKVTLFSSRQMFKCLKIESSLTSGSHVLQGPTHYNLFASSTSPNCALPPSLCVRPTYPPPAPHLHLALQPSLQLLFPLRGTPLLPLFAELSHSF